MKKVSLGKNRNIWSPIISLLLLVVCFALVGRDEAAADPAGVRLRVFVGWGASEGELAAGRALAECLELWSGRDVEVRREWVWRPGAGGFYVGETRVGQARLGRWASADGLSGAGPEVARGARVLEPELWDVSVVDVGGDGVAVFRGVDDGALLLGVYAWAQRELGLRWFVPGEAPVLLEGGARPGAGAVALPVGQVLQRPGFVSRGMWGERAGGGWLTLNGFRQHLHLDHNLGRAVPEPGPGAEVFYEGVASGGEARLHPNLLSEAVVERVVERAVEFFDRERGARGFSLGLEDHLQFGNWEGAYGELLSAERLFRGAVDFSPVVFTFANRVAEGVARVHPDRFLPMLAYLVYENAPEFAVAEQVVPVATADRSQWYDAAFRAEDVDLMRRWEAAGSRLLATWDYAYGWPYLVPRIYLGAQGESVRELHEAGVDVFFFEMNPVWGFDGPKAWLYGRLLWDPGADAVALVEEFFEGFYGAAAGEMRGFFDAAERVWMSQPGRALWIKYWRDEYQGLLFDAEVCRGLLERLDRARAAAQTDAERGRVELTVEAMGPAVALADYLPARFAVQAVAGVDAAAAAELGARAGDYLVARRGLLEVMKGMTATTSANRWPSVPNYPLLSEPLAGRVARVLVEARRGGDAELCAWIEEQFGREGALGVGERLGAVVQRLLAADSVRGANLLWNSRFGSELEGWTVAHWPNPRLVVQAEPGPELRVEDAIYLNMMQALRAEPGLAYVAEVPVRGSIVQWGSVELRLEFFNAQGRAVAFYQDRCMPMQDGATVLTVAAVAPEGAVSARLLLHVRDQDPGQAVWFGRPELRAY